MSLAEDVRPTSRINPSTCEKIKYSSRSDTPRSCLAGDHRWSATQARLLALHKVRHRVLLRSGSLQLLSSTDSQALCNDYRVRTVADLRTPHEPAIDGPSRLARLGAATVHLPLIGDLDRHRRTAAATLYVASASWPRSQM